MPRSVYCPLRHMSNSPWAHAPQGTGSGRRTTPTTRSPVANPDPSGASRTRPRDSWPRTSRSLPGGAQPYSPPAISLSVPQTPTAMPSTSRSPSAGVGSGTSVTSREPAVSGIVGSARMPTPSPAGGHGTLGAAKPDQGRSGRGEGLGGVVGQAVRPDRVVPGVQDVTNHHAREVELGRHPHQDREPVEPVRHPAGGGRRPAAEVQPDAAEVEHLTGGPDQDVAPPRSGERGQREQPQHVLRRVHLVEEQEPQ